MGESVSGLPLQHEASRLTEGDSAHPDKADQNEVEGKHISKTSRLLEGTATRLQGAGKGLVDSAMITDRLGKVSGKVASHMPTHSSGDSELDGVHSDPVLRGMQKKNAITAEAFVASEYAGSATPQVDDESVTPFGAGVADPDGDIEPSPQPSPADNAEDARFVGHEQEPTKSSYYSTGAYTPPATDSNVQHELMLDMAGYKTQGPDDREGDGLKTPPDLSMAQADLQQRIAEGKGMEPYERDPDVLALTRALLRYSESRDALNKSHQRQPCEHELDTRLGLELR